ncbi:hypothetical protein [Leptolyngbya sp. NIES-2104]|uniref:hypothetical protein n=1 Tax=Leptolyngbya sp. NIES-2104 TaxID=1552121 RepID=UPI0006EC9532|nr:hypothetical protein [Leptolyngbya sp. NIES-2104]GAP98601.1 hypothetical protein NIES2104_51560 [Leptolyngbya sp. NIES-2104]
MALQETEAQAKTRFLLALWDANDRQSEIKKSALFGKLKRAKEKPSDYEPIYQALIEAKAIEVVSTSVKLTSIGQQLLADGLKAEDFKFDDRATSVKTANPLLRWIRRNCLASAPVTNGNGKKSAIASYEEFKPVALEIYDRLNRDYNLDNLVPIYRIRREIGERVERSDFNEWLLDMQANDILQLLIGSVEDSAPDKIEDSITTKVNGLRCYAKLLNT